MRADLHIHTYYSDGKYTPQEIARRAAQAGMELISMTDHDSLEGLEEKRAAAREEGLAYIAGWEVSSYVEGARVHVLGYGCKPCAAYREFLQARMEGAVVRARDMIKKGNERFGLCVTLEDAERLHPKKSAPLHTMHVVSAFAQKLGVKKGELYLREFAPGCPCCSALCRPTPFDALEVIHASGGIASLAHPGRIPFDEDRRRAMMDELVDAGLDGIECIHSDHTFTEAEAFKAYARSRSLLMTGGSDFHAEGRRREIGLPPFQPSEELLAVFSRLEGSR